jgi:hypothetical protein
MSDKEHMTDLSFQDVLFFLEVVIVAFMTVADFGFDFPDKYGFDFEHLVKFTGILVIMNVIGVVKSLREQSGRWLGRHLCVPIVFVTTMILTV